jgi:hypothetical protein
MGNVPFSYIIPHPFDNEVNDNYLLDKLWPYLVNLFTCILKYVALNPHKQHTKQNPHWNTLRTFAWFITL